MLFLVIYIFAISIIVNAILDFSEAKRMLLLTQSQPPNKPPERTTLAGFPNDDIKELGDRIANLTIEQADELNRYLERIYEKKI